MDQQTVLFSNKSLKAMIIPLFLEQLLIMLVGMADTLVVSYAGEAAVSGVSLVNQFNTIFIYLFTALASGGAVVISQYIGRKKNDDAGESASQLLSFSTIFTILIAVIVLLGNERMLRLMFGKVEDSVMRSISSSSAMLHILEEPSTVWIIPLPIRPSAQPIPMFLLDPPKPPMVCPLKCVRTSMES